VTASYLHTCAACGAQFYGGRSAMLCAAHRGLRPNGRCFACGRRIRRGRLCDPCARERRRLKSQRWERATRRSANSRDLALRNVALTVDGLSYEEIGA
jgi:hypothetical protein